MYKGMSHASHVYMRVYFLTVSDSHEGSDEPEGPDGDMYEAG